MLSLFMLFNMLTPVFAQDPLNSQNIPTKKFTKEEIEKYKQMKKEALLLAGGLTVPAAAHVYTKFFIRPVAELRYVELTAQRAPELMSRVNAILAKAKSTHNADLIAEAASLQQRVENATFWATADLKKIPAYDKAEYIKKGAASAYQKAQKFNNIAVGAEKVPLEVSTGVSAIQKDMEVLSRGYSKINKIKLGSRVLAGLTVVMFVWSMSDFVVSYVPGGIPDTVQSELDRDDSALLEMSDEELNFYGLYGLKQAVTNAYEDYQKNPEWFRSYWGAYRNEQKQLKEKRDKLVRELKDVKFN